MSEAGQTYMTKASGGNPQKLKAKLTSQFCISKGAKDTCTGPKSQENQTKPDGLIDVQVASSSEVLEKMRRDSGASNANESTVRYSKVGEESVEVASVQQDELVMKIRPELSAKFRPGVINQIIETTIKEHLTGKEYSAAEAQNWTKAITDAIQRKTKEQNFARYKLVACVVLGEHRGQGLSSAYRCLWDAEADCAASYTFTNDTLYCVGMVFGVYFY